MGNKKSIVNTFFNDNKDLLKELEYSESTSCEDFPKGPLEFLKQIQRLEIFSPKFKSIIESTPFNKRSLEHKVCLRMLADMLQTKRADERPEYAKNIIRRAACNVIEERRRNIDVMLDKEKDFSTDRTVFVQQCSQRHTMLECQQQLLGNVHKDEDEILTKLLKRIRVTMTRVQENLVAAVCSEIDSTKAITVDTIQSMEILLLFLEKKKNVEDRQGIACSYINTLRRKLRALNILRRDNPQDEDTITEIIGKFTEIRERLRNGPLKDIFLPNAEEE